MNAMFDFTESSHSSAMGRASRKKVESEEDGDGESSGDTGYEPETGRENETTGRRAGDPRDRGPT